MAISFPLFPKINMTITLHTCAADVLQEHTVKAPTHIDCRDVDGREPSAELTASRRRLAVGTNAFDVHKIRCDDGDGISFSPNVFIALRVRLTFPCSSSFRRTQFLKG